MRARLKCEDPGKIEYTMTITMPAEDWEKLRDQLEASKLSTSYPSWTLKTQITDLLGQARKIYWPKEPATTDNAVSSQWKPTKDELIVAIRDRMYRESDINGKELSDIRRENIAANIADSVLALFARSALAIPGGNDDNG